MNTIRKVNEKVQSTNDKNIQQLSTKYWVTKAFAQKEMVPVCNKDHTTKNVNNQEVQRNTKCANTDKEGIQSIVGMSAVEIQRNTECAKSDKEGVQITVGVSAVE